MILFPAIDLIGGKVVRLERGDRSRCKVYSDDPMAVARSFAEQGASWVHVVDLSAAFGEDEDTCAANSAAIKAICDVDGLSVDVGGGVRSLARIDELAGYGACRIALGTVLVTEPGFAEVAAQGFGELLVADIAVRDGRVKVNGWRDGAGVALDDAVAQLSELGFKHLVYTDIARDGMQTGIDVAAYRHVAEVAGFPVVASGGISTLDDIRALAAVGEGAIEGAITGRALYEGNFTLVQALAEGKRFPPKHCARCLKTCDPAAVPYCITHALIEAVKGNVEEGLFFCGANVGRLDRMYTVRELMDELTAEWRHNL